MSYFKINELVRMLFGHELHQFSRIILVNDLSFFPQMTQIERIVINLLIETDLFATISVISG